MADLYQFAGAYVGKYGMAVVKIPEKTKAPTHDGWQKPGGYFTEREAAEAYFREHPKCNLGVVLGPSSLCSLDVDDMEGTKIILEALGANLDEWVEKFPTISGNPERCRILFRVPEGITLSRHALNWPTKDNPKKKYTIFELRGGAVQDVLPPSIHPDTNKPYQWVTKPDGSIPIMPEILLNMWQNWDVVKRTGLEECPWVTPENPAPKPTRKPTENGSVIDQFNDAHDLESMIESKGYKRIGRRWLSPHSSTKLPGIIIQGDTLFCHHASDPLGDRIAHDAFSVFCELDHGGDMRAAVKDAAKMLGMNSLPAPAVDAAPSAKPATSELDQAIMKLNESYSVVLNGDKVVIARRMLDESGAPEVRFLSTQSFHAYHANNQVLIQDGDKIKPVSVSQQWMKDLRRPTYDGVTFDPTNSSPDAYMNLWQGFAVVPSIDGSWDLLKAHIFDNICEGKQEYFDYIMTWMAQMLQQPKKKPGVMLVFRGDKGVGKSILSDNLQKLLGGHAVKISRADHLTGKFNAHMANRLLVAIEEGFWAGDKSADGPLKDLITSDNVLIEKKGFDPIKVRNCLRFLMTTNNDWVVPATKGDRRYAVFDVGDKQKQNRAYFDPITKQMENGGLETMLHELLNWDLTKANLNDIPQTAALAEQKQQSFDSVEQWWFDVLGSGVIGRDEDKQTYNWPEGNDRIANETLHEAYVHFCRKMDLRHPKTKKAMLKQLKKMTPGLRDGVRLRTGSRAWGVELPTIEQGRSDFDLYTGQENKW